MSSRSQFQALPIELIAKIIEYLEGRPRNSFDVKMNNHNWKKKILYPLLSVSEAWCEAALVSICDNCKVIFDNAQFRKNRPVKRVVMTAPSWRHMFRNSEEAIAWSRYNGAIFPLAIKLVVKLNKFGPTRSSVYANSSNPDGPFDSVARRQRVVDFARILLRLTPAANSVSVVTISVDAIGKPCRALGALFVSELCPGSITCLDVRCHINLPIFTLSLRDVSGLTSIIHGARVPCSPIARLAYHNAYTLRELHVAPAMRDDWTSLISCGNKAPMAYTSLVSLSMNITSTFNAKGWKTVKGVVPFPILIKLDTSGAYPFNDDAPFRGNRRTLQRRYADELHLHCPNNWRTSV
ncbi:hypothetical protein GGI19_005090 [Coemansia pectinata]|uniref:F-box domain-containing protein n=1 Tax=Coemansia pectinata TaxID=1052879 RepID=A0A9W8GXD4_9FUNG|nr:hypothetical protein GGI19_005090 [Coemansia pectinata]